MFVPATIVELAALMADLEANPSVKVVVFQSDSPEFFVAHLDVAAQAAQQREVLGLWRDLCVAPLVRARCKGGYCQGSRPHARCIGNEFVLACDMRFASRQNALFGNPGGRRRTDPGRRGAGMAAAPGRPLAGT